MKVRVAFTVNVSDEFRAALRQRYGQDGRATRKEIRQWYTANADSADDDLMEEYMPVEKAPRRARRRKA